MCEVRYMKQESCEKIIYLQKHAWKRKSHSLKENEMEEYDIKPFGNFKSVRCQWHANHACTRQISQGSVSLPGGALCLGNP